MQITIIRELLDNNYWARDRQLEACAALSNEELLRPLGNSFASIRDTLAHLVEVEWLWLERMQGRAPGALEPPARYPDLAALRERWREVEGGLRAHVATLDDDALERSLTYRNFNGESWTYTARQLLCHLMMHQAYHRGQIATMLRQLGKRAPQTDYLMGIDMEFRSS
jgi:uncharacterized damage-inducible protein DinB